MIPLSLLQQLEDQDLPFILSRSPYLPPRYRWVCRIGPEGDNAIRGFGHSASEALSEALKLYNAPLDLNHSWCLP